MTWNMHKATSTMKNRLSWADENKKAQERLEKKQQLEKRNTQKTTEKAEKAEQVDLFGKFFGGN